MQDWHGAWSQHRRTLIAPNFYDNYDAWLCTAKDLGSSASANHCNQLMSLVKVIVMQMRSFYPSVFNNEKIEASKAPRGGHYMFQAMACTCHILPVVFD